MYTTLIEPVELQNLLASDSSAVIVDCRFSLADPAAGAKAYLMQHIPGAVYADLGRDLCSEPHTDHGRHPLPSPAEMTDLFRRLGISRDSQVIAYDDANGSIAARLWWMLRFMGHDAVAVLDGDLTAWLAAGYPTREGPEQNAPGMFEGNPRQAWLVTADQVLDVPVLVDSRTPERFRGDVEPLDAIAGHIPQAINFHFQRNWNPGRGFLASSILKQQFGELIGDRKADEVAFYCGSGVTACNNLLAMAHAGIGNGRLYAGSWSDWITDPSRPIETGG